VLNSIRRLAFTRSRCIGLYASAVIGAAANHLLVHHMRTPQCVYTAKPGESNYYIFKHHLSVFTRRQHSFLCSCSVAYNNVWLRHLSIRSSVGHTLALNKNMSANTRRSVKTCHFYFLNSSMKYWPIVIFLTRNIEKKQF